MPSPPVRITGRPACHAASSPPCTLSSLPGQQVLQADGGTRCACINAAFLALAAAAVPMRDVVAACAAGYLDSTALLDLNYMEDAGGRGAFAPCCPSLARARG